MGKILKKLILIMIILTIIFGAFTFTGCEKKEFVEIETNNIIELHTWHFTSGVPNNAIRIKYNNENVEFECSVEKGQLWSYELQKNVKKIILKSNDTVYWQVWEEGMEGIIENTFIDIILKINNRTIGYVVIEVLQINPINYSPNVLKSVLLPKINGKYQNVTEIQIRKAIEKVKENREANKTIID